jgi:hypothetical protein
MLPFDRSKTILAGVPTATLRQWLSIAQNAYADLRTGGKPVTVSYDGKSVTYEKPMRRVHRPGLHLRCGIPQPDRRPDLEGRKATQAYRVRKADFST